jgi:hypothetical protein
VAGVGLAVTHALFEGPPPGLGQLLFVSAFLATVEMLGALSGFALLGGWLGLRPALMGRGRAPGGALQVRRVAI